MIAKDDPQPMRRGLLVGIGLVASLAGLCGWLGFGARQGHHDDQLRALLVHAAKQGAINLTTIDHGHAESDVQRIIDSSTGQFREDFQLRSAPFIDVVKKAQSTSVGTVTEAGLEQLDGQRGQVLVAVTVKTISNGKAEEQPRYWRMRMTVDQQADGAKISNVEFVS